MRTNTFAFSSLLLLAGAVSGLTGCELIAAVDHDLIGTGGTGGTGAAGGAGAAGGGGAAGGMGGDGGDGMGGMPACDPSDCPNAPACQNAICDANDECDVEDEAKLTPCEIVDPDDGVCDGAGACVECVDDDQCTGTETCDTTSNTCVPEHCSNNVLDAADGETDVDCGGDCSGCAVGEMCAAMDSNCLSGQCNVTVCAPCVAADCPANEFCDTTVDGGTCVPDLLVGGACTLDDSCPGGFCNPIGGGTSMCCATTCEGTCQSCAMADTGMANGTCANVTANTDPTNDCDSAGCTTGLCVAGGTCGFDPNTTTCGAGPTCAADPDELKPQDFCSGTDANCIAGTPAACAMNFSCDTTSCFTMCAAQNECANFSQGIGGNYCVLPPAVGTMNTCEPKKLTGAACNAAFECISDSCPGTNLCL